MDGKLQGGAGALSAGVARRGRPQAPDRVSTGSLFADGACRFCRGAQLYAARHFALGRPLRGGVPNRADWLDGTGLCPGAEPGGTIAPYSRRPLAVALSSGGGENGKHHIRTVPMTANSETILVAETGLGKYQVEARV